MSDTADTSGQEAAAEQSPAALRYERRRAAHRAAGRVLARPSALATLRERLALLDAAGEVYDLDETADMYGDGVVEALEKRTAALLGME
ncbi:MAG TPA: threonine aldolase, partial [Streptomyces sp.]|nr:threonine aldolase [Streptomyces sp.]